MKFRSADPDSLHNLYMNQLKMLLSAEQKITEALPTMVDNSTDTELKQALQSHLQETQAQVTRLEQILRETTGEAKPIKCEVLPALVEEAEDMIKEFIATL